MTENDDLVDVNQVFEDILLSEERLIREAFDKGYEEGQKQGNPDGYHLGYHRGAELGAELGYYLGVVESLDLTTNHSEKVSKLVELLKNEIKSFPRENLEVDLLSQADSIRSSYKKLCSLLKIDSAYPESDKLNF